MLYCCVLGGDDTLRAFWVGTILCARLFQNKSRGISFSITECFKSNEIKSRCKEQLFLTPLPAQEVGIFPGGCASLDHQKQSTCSILEYCFIMVLENLQESVGFTLGGTSKACLPKYCFHKRACSKGTQRDDSLPFLDVKAELII